MKQICRFFLLVVVLLGPHAYATHMRGAFITAVRDQTKPTQYAYIFTLTLYRDSEGVDQSNAELIIRPQDHSVVLDRLKAFANSPRRIVAPNIEEITYTFPYTFAGSGSFSISFTEAYRNADIVNMTNSINTPIYVELNMLVNPSIGINNTPFLLHPPRDNAQVGQQFCYNLAAFDRDDRDSLSYRLVVPRQNATTAVVNYQSPETVGLPLGTPELGTGLPTFKLDPLTGQLCWDSPGTFGITNNGFTEYAAAMVVDEWRKLGTGNYIRISETMVDFMITVRNHTNKRPRLVVPNDTCIVAGTLLTATITASDPDVSQKVRISSESAPFLKLTHLFPNQPSAVLSVPNYRPLLPEQYMYQGNPVSSTFSWQTDCQHVRNQPYDVVFKAEDNAGPSQKLSDVKVWRVFIAPLPPTGLTASVSDGKNIRLDWQTYTACSKVSQLFIWRTENCQPHTLPTCTQTVPSGYILVGTVPATTTTFTDTFLQSGANYSYRISAGSNVLAFSQATTCLSVTTSPTGRITAPLNDDRYDAPKTLTITAEADVPGGTVAMVEFYNNFAKIGEDKTAPYELPWNFTLPGTYVLTAKIISATGVVGTTAPVTIDVELVNGVEDEIKYPLVVYPVPAEKMVYLYHSRKIRKVSVINHLGIRLLIPFKQVSENNWSADIEGLAAGVYVMQIENSMGRKITRKLVKW